MLTVSPEQENRLLQIEAKFLTNQYSILTDVTGEEGFSRLYQYQLEIISANDNLQAKQVLGEAISFSIGDFNQDKHPSVRIINGIVTAFAIGDYCSYIRKENNWKCRRYFLTISPTLWLMQQSIHNRVFQKDDQTVIDIVKEVLKLYAIQANVDNVQVPLVWDYCTQYNETDFNFFCRILSQAGIYFYFVHENDSHTLYLSNQRDNYLEPSEVKASQNTSFSPNIHSLRQNYQLVTEKVNLATTNIVHSNEPLLVTSQVEATFTPADAKQTNISIFPWQMKSTSDGQSMAKVYAESIAQRAYMCEFVSDYCHLQVGSQLIFTDDYYDDLPNKSQVICSLSLTVADKRNIVYSPSLTESEYFFTNKCTTLPSSYIFRPKRLTKPNPGNLQLATVVSKSGETDQNQPIFCDEYGQLAVKFAWEKIGEVSQLNDQTTPRVRVLHQWNNGIYRVGTPVLIGYIDNDIDKPIILGMVNDAYHMLQGKYTKDNYAASIIKQFSGVEQETNYNAITLNDKKGAEVLDLYAGKDLNLRVNQGDYKTTIENGNDDYKCAKGTRQLKIGGDEKHTNEKDYNHDVSGTYQLSVKGKLVIEASSIELKAKNTFSVSSSSESSIKGSKVTIKGSTVEIN